MSDRERLEDLAISEALGRDAAPDLSGRILGAIDSQFNEAQTPQHGVRSVRQAAPRRSFTQRVAPQNCWRSALIVSAVMLTVIVGLAIYASQIELGPKGTVEVADEESGDADSGSEQKSPAESPDTTPIEDVEPDDENVTDTYSTETNPRPNSSEPEYSEPEDLKPPVEIEPIKEPAEQPEVVKPVPEEVIEVPPAEEETTESLTPNERILKRRVLAKVSDAANIKVRYEIDGHDHSLNETVIRDGAKLESTGSKNEPAVLIWNDGTLTSFFGELLVLESTSLIKLRLISEHVYIDCFNCKTGFELALGKPGKEAFIQFDDSAVLIDKLVVVCLAGQVQCGESVITAGQMAGASRKQKFGKAIDASRKVQRDRLLQNTPARQIHYYDFEDKDNSDYFKGDIVETDGAANSYALVGEQSIGFNLPSQNHIVTPNETITIRLRCTNCSALKIHAFCKNHDDNYGYDVSGIKNDVWFELTVPLSSTHGRADSSRLPLAGDVLTSLSVIATGTNTKLEVDSVSWTRSAIPSK